MEVVVAAVQQRCIMNTVIIYEQYLKNIVWEESRDTAVAGVLSQRLASKPVLQSQPQHNHFIQPDVCASRWIAAVQSK